MRFGELVLAMVMLADLRLEYRKNSSGVYSAVLRNAHAAAVTAYLGDASYQDGYRERHTAIGGDTLGFTNGEEAPLPPKSTTDTGRPLPRNAVVGATRILAVIYADGTTEGEDEAVAMLVSGRHRAYADLRESIPSLEKAATGGKSENLGSFFEAMQSRDQAEGASLDDLQDSPGRMRYRFFMSAVPARALQALQAGTSPGELLTQFRGWEKRLAESKPDIR